MNFDSMENPARRLRAAEVKRIADLETENARLREAIKAAMHEIAKEDFDETYHQLYKGLDPNFEKLDVHV